MSRAISSPMQNPDTDRLAPELTTWGEECGIVGIHSSENVAPLLYYSLFSLQHRGQESAGLNLYDSDNQKVTRHKSLGLLSEHLSRKDLDKLRGNVGVGHVRYATTGEASRENIQPLEQRFLHGRIALAHNGNLTNTAALQLKLEQKGFSFVSSSDTEIFLKLLIYHTREQNSNGTKCQRPAPNTLWHNALHQTQHQAQGAYSIVFSVDDKLLAVRDLHGIRPLVIGRRQNNDGTALHVIASETCALDAIGVPYLRDVAAGESIIIDKDGLHSSRAGAGISSLCAFEYIYFSRSDSYLEGISVHDARYRAGQLLYTQEAVAADLIVGVPDSGLVAAIGYAESSKLPLRAGIVKNRYVARSFIQPDSSERRSVVKVKFNVVKHLVSGKSVLVIDDSLVRGNTSQLLIQELRNAGAKEVHFRLASPKVLYPCFYGIDFPTREELLAYRKSTAELCREIGADSLAFLELKNLSPSVGPEIKLCQGCFTGEYASGYYDEAQNCYRAKDP